MSRTSKRSRQSAKAEVRKLIDELWEAHALAERFRKSHCEAQRTHALGRGTDPEQWRSAMDRNAAAVVAIKARLRGAIAVLKETYNDPSAFRELCWFNDRFWAPSTLLRAEDRLMVHRPELFEEFFDL